MALSVTKNRSRTWPTNLHGQGALVACLALVQNPPRRTPNPMVVALLAAFAPFAGLHGLPFLVHGERRRGWARFAVGLMFVGAVAWFYGGQAGFGLILFEPVLFILLALVAVGGYLALWVEGMVYAWRRLPAAM